LTLKEEGKEDKLDEIRNLRKERIHPFFLWKLNFAEVFQSNGGFDIVIANPPYLSHDKINRKEAIKRNYSVYEPFADLYCYFIELAVKLTSKDGISCFITSNSFIKADYGEPLREFLSRNATINQLLNIQESQVFQSAIVNVAILIFSLNNEEALASLVTNSEFEGKDFNNFVKSESFKVKASSFKNSEWTLAPQEILDLQGKIKGAGKSLEDMDTMIRLGLATGANYAFLIDKAKRVELINRDSNNKNIIKPILRGKDIKRYDFDFANKYIILAKNGVNIKKDYPTIYEYLDSFGSKFKERGAQGKKWWNLRACSFFDAFKKPKIIWSELTNQSCFAIAEGEHYLLNTAYFLLPPDQLNMKYLVGVLNSRLIKFYFKNIAATSGMGTLRWINAYVKKFPIPLATEDEQGKIKTNVDRIIESKNNGFDTCEMEEELEHMVYDLYNLNQDEIGLIEDYFENH